VDLDRVAVDNGGAADQVSSAGTAGPTQYDREEVNPPHAPQSSLSSAGDARYSWEDGIDFLCGVRKDRPTRISGPSCAWCATARRRRRQREAPHRRRSSAGLHHPQRLGTADRDGGEPEAVPGNQCGPVGCVPVPRKKHRRCGIPATAKEKPRLMWRGWTVSSGERVIEPDCGPHAASGRYHQPPSRAWRATARRRQAARSEMPRRASQSWVGRRSWGLQAHVWAHGIGW
jgi:hypothetical protein